MSQYEDALAAVLSALEIMKNEEEGFDEQIAGQYFTIGKIYEEMKEYETAMENYHKGLDFMEEKKFEYIMGLEDVFLRMGRIIRTTYDEGMDDAIHLLENSIGLSNSNQDIFDAQLVCEARIELSKVYQVYGMDKEALENAEKALETHNIYKGGKDMQLFEI